MQTLLPQIKAVQAFKRSIKKKKDDTKLDKELKNLISKNSEKSFLASNQTENETDRERKDKKFDDDIEEVDECKLFKKKALFKTSKHDDAKNSDEEDTEKVSVAFQNSFGKLRKTKKTSCSSNKFGLS